MKVSSNHNLNFKEIIMQELKVDELQQVNGGAIAPVGEVAGGAMQGGTMGLLGGVARGAAMGAGRGVLGGIGGMVFGAAIGAAFVVIRYSMK
ncbi:hypothetical protein VXM60_01730 [Shewanella khirikhana]|uniref:hypothetical protein n=1 Tax=Shewanella khirikhana TaxID=1965282 RepID=UPI0030CCD972